MSMATDSCACQQLIRGVSRDIVQPMVAKKDEKLEFSRRLHEACDSAGIPSGRGRRVELAKMFRVSGEAARKWLSGESIPDTKRLPEIARRLNVRGEWLLTGQGPMRPEGEATAELPAVRVSGQGNATEIGDEKTISALLRKAAPSLEKASKEVQDAVAALVLRYEENPEEGERIAKAIMALLGEEIGRDGDSPS